MADALALGASGATRGSSSLPPDTHPVLYKIYYNSSNLFYSLGTIVPIK